ncbi:MAG: excinuclease ABC subunit UvrC [Peptococcaceae bacterium]|nr:excinuclease ABC subunit UvrC [Peptococcaceae bacterium]
MTLKEKASQLPDQPGVYIYKDAGGNVLYVGKAVSLRNRVRSYFTGAQDNKTQAMLAKAADIDFIVTGSEIEALILESNLIKEHRPRYNIVLKDDKHYPYIKITVDEEYPRVMKVRQQHKDGARYFGPYPAEGAVNDTLRLLKKLFPFRSCRQVKFRNKRPCLNFHIGRCLGPCTGRVDRETYSAMIREVCLFLDGRHDDLLRDLTRKMKEASRELNFERAAELRDQIQAIERVVAKQNMVSTRLEDQDVLALARTSNRSEVVLLPVRKGRLIGQEHFRLKGTAGKDDAEVLRAFIKQYYAEASYVPPEVLLSIPLGEEQKVIEEWLGGRRGSRVHLRVPQRGRKRELVEMACRNAAILQEQMALERDAGVALAELAGMLSLPELPARVEGYDISNIQGHQTVGSMVVFEEGRPAPSEYRRFKIRTVQGPDDYASMREMITRRFEKAKQEKQLVDSGQMSLRDAKFVRLPDLVLIDGGKGQLGAAFDVMHRLGYGDIPVFGLAKEEELLFQPGRTKPLVLPRDSQALYLLQQVRDEAHRFAVTYHRKERTKVGLRSLLEEIEGIGPARRRALLKHFPSLKDIEKAGIDDLAAVKGMNRKAAKAVYDFFHGEK